jgi:hypothetical protein
MLWWNVLSVSNSSGVDGVELVEDGGALNKKKKKK